jgi:hypothetical protein
VLRTPNPGATTNELNAVMAFADDDVWAVGSVAYGTGRIPEPEGPIDIGKEHPLIEHWDGQSWRVVQGLTMSGRLTAVSGSGPDDIWAAGATSGLNAPRGLLLLHWNGQRWREVRVPQPPERQFEVASLLSLEPDMAWLAGSQLDQDGYGPLLLRWDGQKWATESLPSMNNETAELSGLGASSVKDVWAVGWHHAEGQENLTLVLRFDGDKWHIFPSPNGGVVARRSAFLGVSVGGPSDVWAVGNQAGKRLGSSLTFTAHWDGRTWSIEPSPNMGGENNLSAVVAMGPRDAWALGAGTEGYGPQVVIVHWNGSGWRSAQPCTVPEEWDQGTGLSATPGGEIWASGWVRHDSPTTYRTSTIVQRFSGHP